jgi:hypothetical protein
MEGLRRGGEGGERGAMVKRGGGGGEGEREKETRELY